MKKSALILLALATALTATGCKKAEQPAKEATPGTTPQGMPPGHGSTDPHAGIKPQEIPAGAAHKGTVVSSLSAGEWTYVEVSEKGQTVWVAVPATQVKTGDVVEFPDSPPMLKFHSKALNRDFEKVIFAPGLRINAK